MKDSKLNLALLVAAAAGVPGGFDMLNKILPKQKELSEEEQARLAERRAKSAVERRVIDKHNQTVPRRTSPYTFVKGKKAKKLAKRNARLLTTRGPEEDPLTWVANERKSLDLHGTPQGV